MSDSSDNYLPDCEHFLNQVPSLKVKFFFLTVDQTEAGSPVVRPDLYVLPCDANRVNLKFTAKLSVFLRTLPCQKLCGRCLRFRRVTG